MHSGKKITKIWYNNSVTFHEYQICGYSWKRSYKRICQIREWISCLNIYRKKFNFFISLRELREIYGGVHKRPARSIMKRVVGLFESTSTVQNGSVPVRQRSVGIVAAVSQTLGIFVTSKQIWKTAYHGYPKFDN